MAVGISQEAAQQAVDLVNDALRLGGKPPNIFGSGKSAIEEAANVAIAAGIVQTRTSFQSRLRSAKDRHGIEPDWALYTPARYIQPVPKQVLYPASIPEPKSYAPDGNRERVLVIGDLHNDPRHPHRVDVLKWLARLGSERKIGRVVQIGDWGTFDGASTHDKNDTLAARLKPSIRSDLDNQIQSLSSWRLGCDADWKPKLHVTLGNHENRLARFENANPETVGTFTGEIEQNFLQAGWRTKPYGEVMFVEGVGLSHHPINGAGRAFGGKTGPQRAANEMTCSFISGHTHALQHYTAGKIGHVSGVDVLEVGCALPWGEVEAYAKHGIVGWWYGAVIVNLMGGRIIGIEAIDMMSIRDKYSDSGG